MKSFLILFFLSFTIIAGLHAQEKNKKDIQTVLKEIKNRSSSLSGRSWIDLFDGQSLNGWKSFNQEKVTGGWVVQDSNLVALGKGSDMGGDIITIQQYEDFELRLEWALEEGGNSGIFFHVLEGAHSSTYATGPEYQIIDDAGFKEPLEEWQKTGANYAMHPAINKTLNPPGEYNKSIIKVLNGHVEHFLNGNKVVEYDLWTRDWKTKVKNSKWRDYPDYGTAYKGHIGLQDHGSKVKFRNIRIRDLTNIGQPLFNGENLEGWKIHGTEKWYVDEGELICESGPDKQYGYLATNESYQDFMLRLEFKQESNGNSGVFFRSSLDGTRITGWQVEVAPKGNNTGGIYESYGRGWLHQIPENKENLLKEDDWNEMVIRVKGDHIMTWFNGELMSDLIDEKIGEGSGVIALQIHDGGNVKVKWRNIYLKEL